VSRRPRSGSIAFRPRARILKLIGEELISDDVVAVSELVKNSHDADALSVTLSFHGVTGPDGELVVRDNGCGMDLETLLGRWMEPAASSKLGAGTKLTPRGRRVLGEKGVGRFAADKLASNLEIISRPENSPDEIHAIIDWDRFDDVSRMLHEVESHWQLRPWKEIDGHGTILRMTRLRAMWTERMFRRLCIRLGRLLSPFSDHDKFVIRIESDEFPEYAGELRSDILQRAPYRIDARFNGQETLDVSTGAGRPVQISWNGRGELSCGPVRIRIFVFDLEGEALAQIGPRMDVRAWLKEWTGVSIYRDGFRIWPYGEPSDDWLRLDQRRVNNPVEHLSNNQVIGVIEIGRDANPELMDQTNREGLMNNRALEDLKRLVHFVLQLIEAERQTIRHPVKRPPSSSNGHTAIRPKVRSELERLAGQAEPAIGRELRKLGQKFDEQQVRDEAGQERLVECYAGLAAVGQMTAMTLPEIPREIDRLKAGLESLRKKLVAVGAHSFQDDIDRLSNGLGSITTRLDLLRHATGVGERRRAIDIVAELETYRQLTEPALNSRGVQLELVCPVGQVLRTEMRPENLHCVLQILTDNALNWMNGEAPRRIRISVSRVEDRCELIFSDTGPGIPDGLGTQVFEPGFSTRESGRGMGLTIGKRLVESHGGKICLITDARRRGANFLVTLSRKRSRATGYERPVD
jgi:signal transduction histidine kinase